MNIVLFLVLRDSRNKA